MGLSQAKKRVKLSHDPNNTSWSNNTSSFGHKILASHGWTPGEFLGAKDAAHAEFHSAASASHIRVVLKDDNLGLGAKKGSGQGPGECTGLDAFASLLGRLNADDQDEYVQEEQRREDLKKAIYTEQKWGSMRFVKGGFLVGDKVVEIAEEEAERVRNLGNASGSVSPEASDENDSSTEDSDEEMVTKKKHKKEKKPKKQAKESEPASIKEISKREKKRRNKEEVESGTSEETKAERRIRKKSKKEKKRKAEEEASGSSSKKRKEEDDPVSSKKSKKRRKLESTPDEPQHPTDEASSRHKDKKSRSSSEATTPETTEEEAPIPNSSRSAILQGRHRVRARNIAQKRLASMDATALNQIFMIKG